MSPIGEAFVILGLELVLAGGIAIVPRSGLSLGTVLGFYGVVAALAWANSAKWQYSATTPLDRALACICVSFLAALPGVLFFIELLNRRVGLLCYERPMAAMSALWGLVGPILLVIIFPRAWGSFRPVLVVIWLVHAVAWLLGTANSWLCAMTV